MLRKIYKIPVYSVLFFLTTNLFCQPETYRTMNDIDSFTRKLKDVNQKTISLVSDFRQVRHLDILSEDIIASGTFYFRNGNNLRWEYTDPFEYIIIFRGPDIYIKDEERETHFDMASNRMFEQVSRLMTDIVSGRILENENEFSNQFYENDIEYLIVMVPRSDHYKQFFQNIEVYFDRTTFRVLRVKLSEQSEDQTIIEFLNEKRNENIPDKVFDFR